MDPGGKLEGFFKVEDQWAVALGATSYPPLNSFPFLSNILDWMTLWKSWKDRALVMKKEQERVYGGFLSEMRERLTKARVSQNPFPQTSALNLYVTWSCLTSHRSRIPSTTFADTISTRRASLITSSILMAGRSITVALLTTVAPSNKVSPR
jgi:hypothetical protein